MAVSRMKKIQILAHKGAKDAVVAALRDEGALHISEPTVAAAGDPAESADRERERRAQAELSRLEYVRTFLRPYAPKGKPLEKLFSPKVIVDAGRRDEILTGFEIEASYQRCVDLEGRMRSAQAEAARKENLAAEVEVWAGLGARVEDVVDTRLVRAGLLNVEAGVFEALRSDLGDAAGETEIREISRSGSTVHAALLYHKEREADVAAVLKRHGARWVDLEGARGAPDAAAAALRAEAEELRARLEALEAEAEEAASDYSEVLVVADEASERVARHAVEERFATTRRTFLIEGWLRAKDEARVRERLAEVSSEIEIQTRDPEKGERIPIALDNRMAIRPFEFVTTLYGRPVYWEADPTPLLAPFFIVFFGLCVSDGGYGLTLAALSLFFMTKMQPGGGKQLMQLMFMGGVSTAVVGAFTGGWFGLEPSSLPGWLRGMIVMNPLAEPMKMLNVVFVLGVVQIFTGLAIKAVAEFKDGHWLDAILDQIVWIFFLLFLAPLGYNFILGGDVPPAMMDLCRKGAMVAGIVVVATGARKNPNPVMKVLGGVLKLYDVVGYFGDVLSYARLLALGLATGAIAMAINGVADMARGIPYIGFLGAIVVLIGGHLFNIAVNCLSGFVHSGRLQYLEFFSKFFEGGGRAFTPFQTERKYSMIE